MDLDLADGFGWPADDLCRLQNDYLAEHNTTRHQTGAVHKSSAVVGGVDSQA
jgi:hypothetical protein